MKETENTNIPSTRKHNGNLEVLDIVRKKYVSLTPEEWVRQNIILFLHHQKGYPLELMNVECGITLNGLSKRCDIVIYSPKMNPLMIIECKKESVPINQKVLDQAARYNVVLNVPYLYLTNGRQNVCIHIQGQSIAPCSIPQWSKLIEE